MPRAVGISAIISKPRNRCEAHSPMGKLCGSMIGVIVSYMPALMDIGMSETKKSKMPTFFVNRDTSGWAGLLGHNCDSCGEEFASKKQKQGMTDLLRVKLER